MNAKITSDRSLLIPIILGLLSCIGMVFVFLVVRLETSKEAAPVPDTETPFKFLLLATETQPSPTQRVSNTPDRPIPDESSRKVASAAPSEIYPAASGTPQNTNDPDNHTPVPPAATSTITPTSLQTIPITAGEYDDTYIHIIYGSGWAIYPGLPGAYQGSLHVSNVVGSEVRITFEGRGFELGYQPGTNSGSLLVEIDGEQFQIVQAVGNLWVSPEVAFGVHSIRIVHESGGSVNLDYITILG